MNKIICSETRNPQQPIEEVVYRKTRTFSGNRLNFGNLGIPAAIKLDFTKNSIDISFLHQQF